MRWRLASAAVAIAAAGCASASAPRDIEGLPRYAEDMPVGADWIARFAIGAPPDVDREAFVDGIVQSFAMTRERRCYEGRLRELGAIGQP